MISNETTPMHLRQAEGLRQLAAMVEANPDLAKEIAYPLKSLYAPLVSEDANCRQILLDFHRAATTAGASVSVDNEPSRCVVVAAFGPVLLQMSAKAELMVDQPVAPAPEYAPLVLGGAE